VRTFIRYLIPMFSFTHFFRTGHGMKIAAAILIASLVAFLLPISVSANQSQFCGPIRTAGATTSPSYMTAGTATTTLDVSACSDGTTAYESAFLTWQATGSTTPPSLRVRVEVSRDLIDWYPYPVQGTLGSTTPMTTGVNDYAWQGMASTSEMAGSGIASTTAGTPTNLVGARWHGGLVIPGAPYPYMRIKLYVPTGAPAVSVYAALLVKKEQLAR
jgi:hypothetical protein